MSKFKHVKTTSLYIRDCLHELSKKFGWESEVARIENFFAIVIKPKENILTWASTLTDSWINDSEELTLEQFIEALSKKEELVIAGRVPKFSKNLMTLGCQKITLTTAEEILKRMTPMTFDGKVLMINEQNVIYDGFTISKDVIEKTISRMKKDS